MIITGVNIVTMDERRRILSGDIRIEGGRIIEVGRVSGLDPVVVNGNGLTAVPGFVQAHIHLCQTLFRNLAEDMELLDWLRKRIWPLEAAHDEESLAVSARAGIAELIKGGTTTILDMGTVHHTEVIFEEVKSSGIRAIAGKAMMDAGHHVPPGLRESTEDSLEESLRLLKRWHRAEGGRIHYAFSPRFALTCSRELLQEVARLSAEHGTLIHTHASETRSENELVRVEAGMENVEYLEALGLASARLVLAHCVWLNDREMETLARERINVVHCPSCNLKLGSGIAPVPEMLDRGIKVALACDGAPCNNNLDMFQEMRLAALIQKGRIGASAMPAAKVFEMATLGGARALGMEGEIGSIEVGKRADIVLLDLNKVHCLPASDVYSQILFCARASDVHAVIVEGQVLMQERELKTMDEASVAKEVVRLLPVVIERARAQGLQL